MFILIDRAWNAVEYCIEEHTRLWWFPCDVILQGVWVRILDRCHTRLSDSGIPSCMTASHVHHGPGLGVDHQRSTQALERPTPPVSTPKHDLQDMLCSNTVHRE